MHTVGAIAESPANRTHVTLVGTGVLDGPPPLRHKRTAPDCTVQYDYIQVVQEDCIQFCSIIKAEK